MLEERNVKFYMCNGVAEIQGKNGMVRESIIITTMGHTVFDCMIM